MHKEEHRKLLRKRPFRPFRVFTTSGTPIPIRHPAFAHLSPDGRTLFVYQKVNAFDMLDVALIPRFAFDSSSETTEPGPSNGPPAAPA